MPTQPAPVTFEGGLKPDRRGRRPARRRYTRCNRAAAAATAAPRPAPGTRWGRPPRNRRIRCSAPRRAPATPRARSRLGPLIGQIEYMCVAPRGRWSGLFPEHAADRRGHEPADDVFQYGFGQGRPEDEPRAEIEQRRRPRGAFGVRQLHVRDRDDRRVRREPMDVGDELKRRRAGPLPARNGRAAPSVAAVRVTGRCQPSAATGPASGFRRPARAVAWRANRRSRESRAGGCAWLIPGRCSFAVSPAGAERESRAPPDAATTAHGRCRASRPPRSGCCSHAGGRARSAASRPPRVWGRA